MITSTLALLAFVQAAVIGGLSLGLYRGGVGEGDAAAAALLSPLVALGGSLDRMTDVTYRGPVPPKTLPAYDLQIEAKDMERVITSVPDVADAARFDSLVPWVPAVLRSGDTEVAVQVRLGGDDPTHWQHRKRSWAVRFPEGGSVGGMRAVSFLLPEEEGWTDAPLVARRAQTLGLLHPRVGFATLTLNGSAPMLYLMREEWTPDMLRTAGRPAGAQMYRLSGDVAQREVLVFETAGERVQSSAAADALAILVTVSQPGASADPDYLASLAQVTDVPRIQALAMLRLLSGNPLAPHTGVRLLLDPSRSRFEVLGTTVIADAPRSLRAPTGVTLIDEALAVPSIRAQIERTMWTEVGLGMLATNDLQYVEELRATIAEVAYRDPMKRSSNRAVDEALAERIAATDTALSSLRAELARSDIEVTFRIPARAEAENGVQMVLDLTARGPVPASLSGILLPLSVAEADAVVLWRDTGDGSFGEEDVRIGIHTIARGSDKTLIVPQADLSLLWPGDVQMLPDGTLAGSAAKRHRFFLMGSEVLDAAVPPILNIHNVVTRDPAQVTVSPLVDDRTYERLELSRLDRATFLRNHPSFTALGEKGVRLRGAVFLRDETVIPSGITLTIDPGTTVRLAAGASMLVYGPVHARGTERQPIRFLPAQTGKYWGTFAILDAAEGSDLAFVELQGGSGSSFQGERLSAMFVARESAVQLTDVTLSDAGAAAGRFERAYPELFRVQVERAAGDGLQFDQALAGVVQETFVRGAGGDGIVLLGSSVVLRHTHVERAKGSCLRAAARSAPLLSDLTLQECAVGLRAEQGSQVIAERVAFVRSNVGVIASALDTAFAPAAVSATDSWFVSNGARLLEEGDGATVSLHVTR